MSASVTYLHSEMPSCSAQGRFTYPLHCSLHYLAEDVPCWNPCTVLLCNQRDNKLLFSKLTTWSRVLLENRSSATQRNSPHFMAPQVSLPHSNAHYLCVISGFRDEIDENCALLVYYVASNGNFTDVSGQPIGPIFTSPEDGTDWLSRNVCKKLPLLAM
jgi:hypothetical protein